VRIGRCIGPLERPRRPELTVVLKRRAAELKLRRHCYVVRWCAAKRCQTTMLGPRGRDDAPTASHPRNKKRAEAESVVPEATRQQNGL